MAPQSPKQPPKLRRRRRAKGAGSVRLGLLLTGLTAINLYVFVWKRDGAVSHLVDASTTKRAPLAVSGGAPDPATTMTVGESPTTTNPGQPAQEVAGNAEGRTVDGAIGNLDTLGVLLTREGFADVAGGVVTALAKLVDPRTVKPGEKWRLTFDETGNPETFEYRPNPVDIYLVARGDDGQWRASKDSRPVELRAFTVSGDISSSLYGSVQEAGEGAALVSLLVDLFAYDINFFTDTHPGDRWKVQIEKQFLDGVFYRYGKVLAAEYSGKAGTFRAFFHQDGKVSGYFDEQGRAVTKSFLKTPLRFVRLSSKFDRRRMHPILHREKAHMGVDYAAPVGTPVWAAASGKVLTATFKRGSGNTIIIRHPNGYQTRYYHLNKFAREVRSGVTVKQKQTIGYVGTTGLSTGPHLHFGVTMGGQFVDPLKLKPMREASVPRKGFFLGEIAPRLAALAAAVPAPVAVAPLAPAEATRVPAGVSAPSAAAPAPGVAVSAPSQ